MPKAKPDQVVVHRIELQEKEREMLETYIGGTAVKNVVSPIALTAGVGAASYIGYKTAKAIAGWTDDIVDDIKRSPAGRVLPNTPQGRAFRGLGILTSWLFDPVE